MTNEPHDPEVGDPGVSPSEKGLPPYSGATVPADVINLAAAGLGIPPQELLDAIERKPPDNLTDALNRVAVLEAENRKLLLQGATMIEHAIAFTMMTLTYGKQREFVSCGHDIEAFAKQYVVTSSISDDRSTQTITVIEKQ